MTQPTRFFAAALFLGICTSLLLPASVASALPCIGGRSCQFSFGENGVAVEKDFLLIHYMYIDQSVTLTTDNLSTSSADPIMLLISRSTGEVVCSNDDYSYIDGSGNVVLTRNSKIDVGTGLCPQPPTGDYIVVVRSYSESNAGKCDLKIDGTVEKSNAPFGGRYWDAGWSTNESFQAANRSAKGDLGLDTFIVISKQSSGSPPEHLRGNDDAGIAFSARTKTKSTSASLSEGTVVVGRWGYFYGGNPPAATPQTGQLMIYRNDVEDASYVGFTDPQLCYNVNDKDCDGLGDQLEVALGTCPCVFGKDITCTTSYSSCQSTYDAKDTDGDGLPDTWEVFGRKGQDGNGYTQSTELSRFGADPLHKDVFIEVDKLNSSLLYWLTETQIKKIIDVYNIGLGNQANLRNPNNLNGLRLHFDIKGLTPSTYLNSSYGDWGGSNEISFQGATELAPQRTAIWTYLRLASQGGSFSGINVQTAQVATTTDPSVNPDKSVAATVHELAHTLGIDHGGDPHNPLNFNCSAHYPSIMNYGYLVDPPGSPLSAYKLQFSDGSFPALNPFTLNEQNGLFVGGLVSTMDYGYLTYPEYQLKIQQDGCQSHQGSIDWNRNGTCETSAKAYLGTAEPTQCAEGAKSYSHYQSQSSSCINCNFKISLSSSLKVSDSSGVSSAVLDGKIHFVTTITNTGPDTETIYFRSYNSTGNWGNLLSLNRTMSKDSTPELGALTRTNPSEQKLALLYVKNASGAKRLASTLLSTTGVTSTEKIHNDVEFGDDKEVTSLSVAPNKLQVYYVDVTKRLLMKELQLNGTAEGQWSNPVAQQRIPAGQQTPVDIAGRYAPAFFKAPDGNLFMILPTEKIIPNTQGEKSILPEIYRQTSTNQWEAITDFQYNSSPNVQWQDNAGYFGSLNNKAILIAGKPHAFQETRAGYQPRIHMWLKNTTEGKTLNYMMIFSPYSSTSTPKFALQIRNDISASTSRGPVSARLYNGTLHVFQKEAYGGEASTTGTTSRAVPVLNGTVAAGFKPS